MVTYVAYYRVSTDRQGLTGYGLDAQRASVAAFAKGRGNVIESYTEVESSTKYRPELERALEKCRVSKSVLLVAKLDRLSRNVAFISNLLESRIEFIACDMPEANRLTVHLMAAFAEHEREMISLRTKEALRAAKLRGVKLGSPSPTNGIEAHRSKCKVFNDKIIPIAAALRSQGKTLLEISNHINGLGIKPMRGAKWYPASIRNILA